MAATTSSMATPLRLALSRLVGWLADRRVPKPLRAPVYRTYARLTGAQLDEVRLPLDAYPSLCAFFVRELVPGARPLAPELDVLPSPVDGRVQSIGTVSAGDLLQAKGQSYSVDELVGGPLPGVDLEGASAWTIYLSPRDYHRIHAPVDCRLEQVRWRGGARYSVAPKVLARTPRVLCTNERAVLHLHSEEHGPFVLVLVGALNVGRIRVRGVPPAHEGAPPQPLHFERGGELGRFEMGSTIVLLWPAGRATPAEALEPGSPLRLGEPIGRLTP